MKSYRKYIRIILFGMKGDKKYWYVHEEEGEKSKELAAILE